MKYIYKRNQFNVKDWLFQVEIVLINNVDPFQKISAKKKLDTNVQIFFPSLIEGKSRKTGSY